MKYTGLEHDPEIKRRNAEELARLKEPETARSAKPLREAPPECWLKLTPGELQTLVWSEPTAKIAEKFGVSDSAVGKRCRKEKIKKPPVGFWAKVYAGKIPHPQGKPQ